MRDLMMMGASLLFHSQNRKQMAEIEESVRKEKAIRKEYVCACCKNCPQGNKRFCKQAGHYVRRSTSAWDCKNFEPI